MMRIATLSQYQRQSEMISIQFEQMNNLYLQGSTGKKLIHSSDDPVLAGQLKTAQDFVDVLESYNNNGSLATARTNLFDQNMKSLLAIPDGTINNINTTIENARTGTLSDAQRLNLAQQLQSDLNSLLNVANTVDASGEYIYSGFNSDAPPYVLTANGYQYQGTPDQAMITVGQNVSTVFSESGFNVFGNIPLGNGTFTVTAGSGNTGTASTSAGTVQTSSYVPDTYTVSFATNSSGQMVYSVTGAASGQVIPPPPASIPDGAPVYVNSQNGQNISFNGVNITIHGQPTVNNDSFVIAPSTKQNVFDSLQSVINILEQPISNQGQFDQALSQAAASFTQVADHLTTYHGNVGTSSKQIANTVYSNKQSWLTQKTVLKNLGEADIAQVFSALSQQQLALQATQASYLKMQDTFSALLKL